jgi:choline-sulfatase
VGRPAIHCLAAALLATAAACGPASGPSSDAPNVLLVTIDTLRPDHLGAYGFPGDSSPSFDALAARGVVFERAIAASARTAPSHASLFTSRWVRDHSIGYRNGSTRLGDEVTLATIFGAAGYDTAAFVGNSMLRRRVGLDRGFAVFDDVLPDEERNRPVFERIAEKTTHRALEWLARPRRRPYFLWVQFNDPHGPYTPPPSYAEPFAAAAEREAEQEKPLPALDVQRGLNGIPAYQVIGDERRPGEYRARYTGEIRYFDAWLGRLLEAAEAAADGRENVVVVTADHGESLGEDGFYFSHGFATTPNLVHVPLVVVAPGIPPGRVDALVHHVDVLPTLLELAGLPPPIDPAGVSLVGLMQRGEALPERTVYADVGAEVSAYRGDGFVRLRLGADLGDFESGRRAAFTWRRDGSWTPAPPAPELERSAARYASREPHTREAPAPSRDDERRLRALGYLEPEGAEKTPAEPGGG